MKTYGILWKIVKIREKMILQGCPQGPRTPRTPWGPPGTPGDPQDPQNIEKNIFYFDFIFRPRYVDIEI